MISQESPSEIAACVCLAVGVFSASLVPFFLLVEAEHLVPRRVRELAALAWLLVLSAWDRARLSAVLLLLAFLLRFSAPKGALR